MPTDQEVVCALLHQRYAGFKNVVRPIFYLLSNLIPRGNQQIHNQNSHVAAQVASLTSRLEEQARYIDALSARLTGNLEHDDARADPSSHITQLLLDGLDLIPREQLPADERAALLAAVASPTHADIDLRGLAPEPADQVGGRREAMTNTLQGGVASDAGVKRADLQREDAVRSCQAAQAAAVDVRAQLETAERNWREVIRPTGIVSPTPAEKRAEEAERAWKEKEKPKQADERAEKAEKELRAANEAREEAERDLRNGIRLIIIPTQAQYEAMKRRLDFCHIAIAGVSGGGKSSLINAFRGLGNGSRFAAPITTTTATVTRYPDPDPKSPVVWYDVPGAGTLDVPGWQYFTDQGLYVFDCILVVVDILLTETDIAILRNCARSRIPSFIVRSKSCQYIKNVLNDMDGDDEDDATRKENARKKYIRETQCDFALKLDQANLLVQRVYLVDKDVLVRVARGELCGDVIDERALCADILELAHALTDCPAVAH